MPSAIWARFLSVTPLSEGDSRTRIDDRSVR